MAKSNSTDSGASVPTELHNLLFKADRPRAIDHYIDFFGTSAAADDRGDAVGPERDW